MLTTTCLTGLSLMLAGYQPPEMFEPWTTNSADKRSAIEFSSLMTSLKINPKNQHLEFDPDHPLVSVYMPPGFRVWATLTKVGEKTELMQNFGIPPNQTTYQFLRLAATPSRGTKPLAVRTKGEYLLQFHVRGNRQIQATETTQLRFSVDFEEFNGKPVPVANGPWDLWAYLWFPYKEKGVGRSEVRLWRRATPMTKPEGDVYTVLVLNPDHKIIAQADSLTVNTPDQTLLQFPLKQGNQILQAKELLAKSGTHHIVVIQNDRLDSVFPFEVEPRNAALVNPGFSSPYSRFYQPSFPQQNAAGKGELGFKFHERQNIKYDLKKHIVPRMLGNDPNGLKAGDTIWMTKLSQDRATPFKIYTKTKELANPPLAEPIVNRPPKPDWVPKPEWIVTPTRDPNRAFQSVVTNFETLPNTSLAAGEDVIAFWGKDPNALYAFKVGNDFPQFVADPAGCSKEALYVLGKNIVFIKDRQVMIYNTDTKKNTSLPLTKICLFDVKGGLHANGHLLACVNLTSSVEGGHVISVVDLSGNAPEILPIQNAGYLEADASSVAVDAQSGVVAVACHNKDCIYWANINPNAKQQRIDLTDQGGIAQRQIQLVGDFIAYLDDQNRLRVLDRSTGKSSVLFEGPVRETGQAFVVRGYRDALNFSQGKVIVAAQSQDGAISAYHSGSFPGRPQAAANLGDLLKDRPSLGMGTSAAITEDGTLFLAGEKLQTLTAGRWEIFQDDKQQPLPAKDVTAGESMLAFKSQNAEGQTVLGYLIYGEKIEIPSDQLLELAPKTEPKPPENPITSVPVETADPIVQSPQKTKRDPQAEDDATTVKAPVPKQKGLGSQLWLIALVFAAHLGIGTFFTWKILK